MGTSYLGGTSNNDDVASKKYVDDAVAGASGGATPSSTTPAMDGTASVGTENAFARGDHVHPTDTSRAAANNVVTLDGDQTITGKKRFSSVTTGGGKFDIYPGTHDFKPSVRLVSLPEGSCTLHFVASEIYLNQTQVGAVTPVQIHRVADPVSNTDAANKQYVDSKTRVATDADPGTIKLNSAESITVDANGNLKVGGRIGQFPGTTGLFAPNNRDPRNVPDYSLLITDALGVDMKSSGSRSLAIVSGYGIACQSAPAGSTVYRLTNNYQNRIIAKMAEGGYASRDEATSKVERIIQVLSVTINGSTFTPNSSADSSTPIEITVAETLNPDAAITNIRLFGSLQSYATAHIGNGVKSESGGRSLMIGGGITKAGTNNDVCMVGNAIYNSGNGNAIFGRYHISRKNRWLIAGTGHDNTNGISEAGVALGQYSDIQSDTAFAVGNGTSHTSRSNLFEVKTNGDVYINGVKVLP